MHEVCWRLDNINSLELISFIILKMRYNPVDPLSHSAESIRWVFAGSEWQKNVYVTFVSRF